MARKYCSVCWGTYRRQRLAAFVWRRNRVRYLCGEHFFALARAYTGRTRITSPAPTAERRLYLGDDV